MKRILISITAAMAALALPSCLQNHQTIILKKDGSGSYVEEVFPPGMFAGFGVGGGDPAESPTRQMISDEATAQRVAELGEGVTLVKAEEIKADGKSGVRLTFAFKDINKLELAGSGGNSEQVSFQYEGDTLTVGVPKPAANDAEVIEGPHFDGPEGEAIKEMLSGLKMSMKLEFPGGIATTDASHAEGNTVTVLDMDMSKVLEGPEAAEKLKGMEPENMDFTKMQGIDGIKAEAKRKFTVKLK